MTSEPSISFDIPESTLLSKFGLSAAELKKYRATLTVDLHWGKTAGNRIQWSSAGAEALARLLSPPDTLIPPLEKLAPDTLTLTVIRGRTPRVLHVKRDGQPADPARPLCVWLPQPKARLFLPGMRVLAQPRPGRDDLFDFAGNPAAAAKGRRFPRAIGRW